MSDTRAGSNEPPRQRARARGHAAGIGAVAALAVTAAVWYWTTRQPAPPDADIGLQHGVIVVGGGAFLVALIVKIRAMSFWDILEVAWA